MLKTSAAVSIGGIVGRFGSSVSKNKDESIVPKGAYSCLVKHGQAKRDKLFSWAVLSVADGANEIRAQLEEIKEKFKYRTELKYSSNDRYKEEVSKEFINFFIKSGMVIDVLMFQGDAKKLRSISPMKYQQKMIEAFGNLRSMEINSKDLVMKVENQFGPSRKFKESVMVEHGFSMVLGMGKFDVMLQLNDLISGIVHGFISGNEPKSRVRKAVNDYFGERFGVKYGSWVDMIGKNIRIKYFEI